MRKPKVIAGICLLAQALLLMILFISYWHRSKSIARTLAILSAASGLGGAWLLLRERRAKKLSEAMDYDFDADDEFDDLEEDFDGEVTCSFGEA